MIVNKTFSNGNTIKKESTTNASSIKIPCDVLISEYLFTILAITDVPPSVLPVEITKPAPTPIIAPPKTELITKLSMPRLIFSVKCKKKDSAVFEITV